ncbi:hypothetical protein POM88_036306 [Heracleum sosnowskyi]|uniref:Uncharacterized protein n=1 Tax=Heracleum sosnowskyi TaxID=360622 RepID=A0AAD8HPJ3_9APIA|nr:hypothetical protein POM88_036306 [Heracleum sosnowskyi]
MTVRMRFKFLWMLQKLKYFQNSEVEVKPLRSLPYDLPGQTFVAFEKPEGVTAVGNFLKCLEIYCERAEDGGVEDEYQSEDLEVVAEDYILKGSEVVPNNARPRTCLLSGVYIENVKGQAVRWHFVGSKECRVLGESSLSKACSKTRRIVFPARRIGEALAVVTLGDKQMAQRIDNLVDLDDVKRFYLQLKITARDRQA